MAHASGLPEVARFAKGLDRDRAVVVAGLTHPGANGDRRATRAMDG
ncbi:MAG: hypothetical protein H0X24_11350 [Ktedonobacterales bacterium]|nr:hypothetical protein [Ktedonobacterales bacterium]